METRARPVLKHRRNQNLSLLLLTPCRPFLPKEKRDGTPKAKTRSKPNKPKAKARAPRVKEEKTSPPAKPPKNGKRKHA